MQRAGRGGRNRLITARAILLVQPSVFQEMKASSATSFAPHDEESDVNYRKAVEEGLREWIETEDCRRDVADEYFWDGSQRKRTPLLFFAAISFLKIYLEPKGICCDNCLRKSSPDHPLLASTMRKVADRSVSPSNDAEDSPSDKQNSNGKRVMAEASSIPNRREDHLHGARQLLEAWRLETWMKLYRRSPWGIQALLPDTILTALATKARLQTLEDFISAGWSPTHVQRHGTEMIDILKDYDDLFKSTKEEEIKARAEKKKQESAAKLEERRNKAKEERARQREIRAAQPKPPRASRAKKTKVLASSGHWQATVTIPNATLQPLMYHVSPTTPNTNPALEGENIPPHSSSSPFTPTAMTTRRTTPFHSPIPTMDYLQPSTNASTSSTSYNHLTSSHSFASLSAYSYPFQVQPTTPLNIRQSFNPYSYTTNLTPYNVNQPGFNPLPL
jgi:bloom syndrome protein